MDHYRTRSAKALAALVLLWLVLIFAASGETLALDEGASGQVRHVWFSYGYTECNSKVHPLTSNTITPGDDSAFPQNYSTEMMLCDTDHKVRVEGQGVTADNVTLESLNPSMLAVDSEGNVTLNKEGSATIKATVAADDVYDERTVYLYVKAGRHDGWDGSTHWAYYEDRARDWGLDLDVSDGPHQINMCLRPGAKAYCYSSQPEIAYVSRDGVITPLSAGTAYINFVVDDGGGRYKPAGFMCFANITGESTLKEQEITGDLGPFEINWHDGLQLDLHAETKLEYSVINGDNVSVDETGFVEFTQDCQAATIQVVAVPNEEYKSAVAVIYISAVNQEELEERDIRFEYGCTECGGYVRPVSAEGIGHTNSGTAAYPTYYTVDMMMCDTDHVLRVKQVAGDVVIGNDISLTSLNPEILEINSAGKVTLKSTGKGKIKAFVPADDTYAGRTVYLTVNVGRHDPYDSTVPFRYAGKPADSGLDLDVSEGPQQLVAPLRPGAGVISYTSDDPAVASVDSDGVVTPLAAGHTVLRLTIDDGNGKYRTPDGPVLLDITVTKTATEPGGNTTADPAGKTTDSKAAAKAAQAAALKKEIAKAKSLKRPSFKVKALKRHRNKLTWGKVANAGGYIVYIKYPGSKKFVKAVTRKANVKSVTHKGLSKGKVYRYKVRAFKKVKGVTYYGPFSKVRKVRAK